MFKLVPNKGLMPASGELIKGMYIPREYMHFLIGEHGPKGVRGGRLIAFENTNRYLTNTQFAEFIQNGLIGSRGVQSDALKDILRDFFERPRSIVLAYESQRYF